MFTLPHKIAVYVPSTINVSENAETSLVNAFLQYVETSLASLFGGCTTIPAIGSYVANDGSLVRESVNIVYAFASDEDFSKENLKKVLYLAERLCLGMTQECIGVELDGRFILADTTPQKTLQLKLA